MTGTPPPFRRDRTPRLRPVAAPVDTFVTGQRPLPGAAVDNSLLQIARGLGPLSKGLQDLAAKQSQEREALSIEEAEARAKAADRAMLIAAAGEVDQTVSPADRQYQLMAGRAFERKIDYMGLLGSNTRKLGDPLLTDQQREEDLGNLREQAMADLPETISSYFKQGLISAMLATERQVRPMIMQEKLKQQRAEGESQFMEETAATMRTLRMMWQSSVPEEHKRAFIDQHIDNLATMVEADDRYTAKEKMGWALRGMRIELHEMDPDQALHLIDEVQERFAIGGKKFDKGSPHETLIKFETEMTVKKRRSEPADGAKRHRDIQQAVNEVHDLMLGPDGPQTVSQVRTWVQSQGLQALRELVSAEGHDATDVGMMEMRQLTEAGERALNPNNKLDPEAHTQLALMADNGDPNFDNLRRKLLSTGEITVAQSNNLTGIRRDKRNRAINDEQVRNSFKKATAGFFPFDLKDVSESARPDMIEILGAISDTFHAHVVDKDPSGALAREATQLARSAGRDHPMYQKVLDARREKAIEQIRKLPSFQAITARFRGKLDQVYPTRGAKVDPETMRLNEEKQDKAMQRWLPILEDRLDKVADSLSFLTVDAFPRAVSMELQSVENTMGQEARGLDTATGAPTVPELSSQTQIDKFSTPGPGKAPKDSITEALRTKSLKLWDESGSGFFEGLLGGSHFGAYQSYGRDYITAFGQVQDGESQLSSMGSALAAMTQLVGDRPLHLTQDSRNNISMNDALILGASQFLEDGTRAKLSGFRNIRSGMGVKIPMDRRAAALLLQQPITIRGLTLTEVKKGKTREGRPLSEIFGPKWRTEGLRWNLVTLVDSPEAANKLRNEAQTEGTRGYELARTFVVDTTKIAHVNAFFDTLGGAVQMQIDSMKKQGLSDEAAREFIKKLRHSTQVMDTMTKEKKSANSK